MAALALLSACSSSSDGESLSASSTTTTSSSTTTTSIPTTTTEQATTTIVEVVPAPHLTSAGSISIDSTTYDFAFECYAAGAGDVLALGVGTEPITGDGTQAIVQAFLGQPYVAIVIDGSEVFELAVDREAELFVQQGSIQGSALRFVASDESAGVGEALGLGTVDVTCDGFAPGLPEGYVTALRPESADAEAS